MVGSSFFYLFNPVKLYKIDKWTERKRKRLLKKVRSWKGVTLLIDYFLLVRGIEFLGKFDLRH